MTKAVTFDTNGLPSCEFISGEQVYIYFCMKFSNAPEYFALSLVEPAVVRMRNADGSLATFNGQLVCYYPGIFLLSLTCEQTAALKTGAAQDLEVQAKDVNGVMHMASRPKSLNVKAQLIT